MARFIGFPQSIKDLPTHGDDDLGGYELPNINELGSIFGVRNMLNLWRRKEESVVADEDIHIKVLDVVNRHGRRIEGARVKLGFTAPDEVPIDRLEIHERKMQERGE